MDLRHLRHFVGIASYGSFSEAAKNLYITQPALTRSIHLLEDELGTRLLDRTSRGTNLTETGRILFRRAKLILNEIETAQHEVTMAKEGAYGDIHIGIPTLFVNKIVDAAIARLIENNQSITVSVTAGVYEDMAELLYDGRLNFVFSTNPNVPFQKEIEFEPICEISSVVVASTNHPLAKKSSVRIEELLEADWVMIEQRHMESFMETFFAAEGLPAPRSKVRTNSLEMVRSMVCQEACVAILPTHWIIDHLEKGEMRVLDVPSTPIERKAGIVHIRDRFQNEASKLLMQELRNVSMELGALAD